WPGTVQRSGPWSGGVDHERWRFAGGVAVDNRVHGVMQVRIGRSMLFLQPGGQPAGQRQALRIGMGMFQHGGQSWMGWPARTALTLAAELAIGLQQTENF